MGPAQSASMAWSGTRRRLRRSANTLLALGAPAAVNRLVTKTFIRYVYAKGGIRVSAVIARLRRRSAGRAQPPQEAP